MNSPAWAAQWASTVWAILKKAGIDPVPRRSGPTWAHFLHNQASGILAVDLFHVDTVLLRRLYCMVAMEISNRQVHIRGVTAHPTGSWAVQQARALLMALDDRVDHSRFLIRDRDAKFSDAFDAVFASEAIQVLLTPVRAPRADAYLERWIGGCRQELLDHTLIINERHLRNVLAAYETHFNTHRPHRALHQAAPLRPLPDPGDPDARVVRHYLLGGVIHARLLGCSVRTLTRAARAAADTGAREVIDERRLLEARRLLTSATGPRAPSQATWASATPPTSAASSVGAPAPPRRPIPFGEGRL